MFFRSLLEVAGLAVPVRAGQQETMFSVYSTGGVATVWAEKIVRCASGGCPSSVDHGEDPVSRLRAPHQRFAEGGRTVRLVLGRRRREAQDDFLAGQREPQAVTIASSAMGFPSKPLSMGLSVWATHRPPHRRSLRYLQTTRVPKSLKAKTKRGFQ